MCVFRIHDVLPDKVLVSREAARALQSPLRAALSAQHVDPDSTESPGEVGLILDFTGVEGLAPSFMDELLAVIGSVMSTPGAGAARGIVIAHAPTRLSLKFQAIARGRGLVIHQRPDHSWLLSPANSVQP